MSEALPGSSVPPFWTRRTVLLLIAFLVIAAIGVVTVVLPEVRGTHDAPSQVTAGQGTSD